MFVSNLFTSFILAYYAVSWLVLVYYATMVDVWKLVDKYALVSDQVSKNEVAIVLSELDRVIEQGIAGDVVELGCYKGTTSLFMARLLVLTKSTKKLWLYDSFQGLPAKTEPDQAGLGAEFVVGALAATKSEVLRNFAHANLPRPIIHKAWFSDLTTTDMPQSIAFAYFDGDYYSSIVDSFRLCTDLLSPGAIIVIDDYSNSHLPGVALAVNQWMANNRSAIARFTVQDSLAIIQLVL